MGIQSLNFNNAYNSSDRRIVDASVLDDRRGGTDRRLAMRESDNSIFEPELTCNNIVQNEEVRAFLPPKQTDNFFLKQSDFQINPFEYTTPASPPKRFVLTSKPNSMQNPFRNDLYGGIGSSMQNAPIVNSNPKFGMNTENQIDKTKDTNPFMRAVECTFTPFRRFESAPDEINKGNLIPALGAIGLTAINFPEDWSDIKTATHQISSYFKGEKYEGAYNYLKSQHEFSFFRGTLLGWMVDRKKHPKMAEILLKWDKSLWQTSFGTKLLSLLKTEQNDFENVKKYNKETKTWELAKDINGIKRKATEFKGKWFGEITARALSRTTLIGTGIFALMELYNITKAATKGDTIEEKAENGAKQTAKSSINLVSMTAGIAFIGAIGAKYKKGFGSLVGMGFGAALGGFVSHKLQDTIS